MKSLPTLTSAAGYPCSACAEGIHTPSRPNGIHLVPLSLQRAESVVSPSQSRGGPRSGRRFPSLHTRAISEPAEARPRPLSLRPTSQPSPPPKRQSVLFRTFNLLPWHRQRTLVLPPTEETVAQAAASSRPTFRYPDAATLTDYSLREGLPMSTAGESAAEDLGGASAVAGRSIFEGESYEGPESIIDGIDDICGSHGAASFSPKAARIGNTVFGLLGFSSLVGWNFTINLAPYISAQLFPDSATHWDNSFLAMFQIAILLVQACLLWIGALRKSLLFIGGCLSVVVFSILTPVLAYLPETVAITGMHLMCFLTGLSSGLFQGAGFAIAGAMPKTCVGAVSVGQGLAGVGAFLLSTLLGFAVFPLDTRVGVQTTAWTVYLFSALVALLSAVSVSYLFQQPWARRALKKASQQRTERMRLSVRRQQEREIDEAAAEIEAVENSVTESDDVDLEAASDEEGMSTVVHGDVGAKPISPILVEACAEPSSRRIRHRAPELYSKWHVLQTVFPELLSIFLNFFITMNLFPRVGPVLWKYSQNISNHFLILFGVFSVGDVAGRWLPDLSQATTRLQWLMLPRTWLLPAVLFRTIFYVPFCLGYKVEGAPVINDFWWYVIVMFLFAVTHGWTSTLGYIYCVSVPSRLDEKEIAGPLAVIALSLGLVTGLYIAFLVY
ncbi:nucleoside transporter [Toxoplasma gondii VAND]|uniref:Nucleoside transporter n=1 Tax=Toxoplasma gondii VAND TaxID=933077 RepID=A0A086QG39_TOXGO|nr:nucleoside transporter [Toxoplasma gondii VAND]